jgi:MFS family permease
MMLMYIADSATSNWSAVYLHTGLHSSPSVAALGLAAYQTCMVLGRALADRFVARHGPVRAVAAGGVVGVLGLLLVVAADGPALGIAGFAVLGLGLCVVVPQSFSAAGQLDPAGTGLAVARVNLFNYVGFVVGAGLIGLVAQGRGLRMAFGVPAVLAIGIVVLARSFRPRTPVAVEVGRPPGG